MRLLSVISSILFFFSAATTCFATSGQKVTVFEMEGKTVEPSLIVMQQKKDGSSQILEQPSEEYPAIVPYFLEYIEKSIEESAGELDAKNASAIAVAYGYPDNLEINILSDKREKIVKKIKPDAKLHDLRIRTAMLMLNFIKDENGSITSNATVGFQLFPEETNYSSINVVPDYDIQQGSWIMVWEKTIAVKTKIYETAHATVIQTIRTVRRVVRVMDRIRIIGRNGRVKIVVRIRVSVSVRKEVKTVVIPEKDKCQCFKIMAPPASPVQNHNPRFPCGQPFYRSKHESCSVVGKQRYPNCDRCN
jgi:hypothetical protein